MPSRNNRPYRLGYAEKAGGLNDYTRTVGEDNKEIYC